MIKTYNELDKLKVLLFDEKNLYQFESLDNPLAEDERNLWNKTQNKIFLSSLKFKD